MVSLHASVDRESGITLVRLQVENGTPVARRVRIENRIDGPLWPPRTRGVPEEGWDETGVEVVVGPGERRTLGYATDGRPAGPPAEVVAVERVAASAGERSAHADLPPAIETSADGVVRELPDPTPPADAVPVPEPETDDDRPDLPPAVASWLGEVASRVERAEALAGASSVTEAARAVEDADGLDGVAETLASVDRDVRALDALESRLEELRARGTTARNGTSLETLRRLA